MKKKDNKKEYQVFYAYKEGDYIRKKLVKDENIRCDSFKYVDTKDKNVKLLLCITKDKKEDIKAVPISLLIKKDSPAGNYILRKYRVIVINKENKSNIIPSTFGSIFNY